MAADQPSAQSAAQIDGPEPVRCTICCAVHLGWTPEGEPVTPISGERMQRAINVGLRYKAERDKARRERNEANRRYDAMTEARDHCKRQATEAGDRLVAANVKISRLRQQLGEATS